MRPITLKVVDFETKRPLSGIDVSYAIQVSILRGKLLGLVPAADPTIGFKLVYKARGRTGESGEVTFRDDHLRLAGNEEVSDELVAVNVGVEDQSERSRFVLELLQDACRERRPTCLGSPDEIDVIWQVATTAQDRADHLRPANSVYRGQLLVVTPVLLEPPRDGAGPEVVSVRDVVSQRSTSELVVVELRRNGDER